ncbi:MAG: UbiA family prenyltransferase [archaeon]|nr:UbiA family prenyltransferase [archaeon]
MNLKAFVELVRPINCLMATLGTFIGFAISSSALQLNFPITIAMAVAFLICGGGMVVNDFFDLEIDKKLKPGKPIASGQVSAKTALVYTAILFLLGNALAFYFLPLLAFAITLAFTAVLILYSWLLAKAKYVGNFVVASGTAFTLIFGASLVGNFEAVAFLAVAALSANVARELIKDLEDVKADKGFKVSLPMLISQKTVKLFVLFYSLEAILLVYIPLWLGIFGNFYFAVLMSIANIGFVASYVKAAGNEFSKAQVISKASMLIALIGFLAGVL